MQHIILSKKLEWLRPYLDAAKGLVNTDKLKAITHYTVPISKVKHTEACLIRYDTKNYKMTITLYDHKRVKLPNGKFKMTHKRHRLSYILDSLAHELAHLKYFDHRPEHIVLQCKILARMAKVAKKLQITDTTMPWRSK
jgi:predicted metal-dependent hydrolase